MLQSLIQNKIPFKFDEIIVDVKYTDMLTNNLIPYENTENPKKREISLDQLMRTIQHFLSQLFNTTTYSEKQDLPNKCKIRIEVNEIQDWFFNPYKNCVLHLYINKLKLQYDEDIVVIYFNESIETINNNMPFYIYGLILLIIADNHFRSIVTDGWLNFCFACKEGYCTVKVLSWDNIDFEVNGKHKNFTSLKCAIEELKK